MTTATTPRLLAAAALLAALGCGGGGTGTVNGEVTFEGAPVKAGYISFIPADGKGATAAAPITDGKFGVEKIPPGPKVVKVEASSGPGPSVQSSADMERLSREWKGKVSPSGIIKTETVPADADGNNQAFDVKAGSQTLNLTLTKPGKKK